MKVILIAHYKSSFPYIDELSEKLQEKGIEVLIFDMIDMLSVNFSKDGKKTSYHINNTHLRNFLKLPKIGLLLKEQYYIQLLKKNYIEGDHLSIHFVSPYYRKFMPAFQRIAKATSAVVWGSDFYRASRNNLAKVQEIFDACDKIIISNTKMASDFTKHYEKYSEKIKLIGFGIGKLDLINEIMIQTNKSENKMLLGLPPDKLIVTIGYNGIKPQQHLLIIDALSKIPEPLKKELFIIVPFGYGGKKPYKSEIKLKLNKSGISYRIFDEFITDLDVARIRICTDVAINAQISDQASASIQEHLFAGNVLLAGNWLPYQYFSDNGIKFWTFTKEDLLPKILHILENFNEYEKEVVMNKERIYNLSSWNSRIDQWIKTYKPY